MIGHKDDNEISDQGCFYLSEGEFNQLQTISLGTSSINEGSNLIGNQGCGFLARANWSNLQLINLCSGALNQL